MIEIPKFTGTKAENYQLCVKQVEAMITGEPNFIANISNISALLNQALTDINWVGFYLYEEVSHQLVLGPFQGLPACIRIPLGRGVCGSAAAEQRTYLVQNVHDFPGHIACDAASNSEIVIPIVHNGKLLGVLDVDSPSLARFDTVDQHYLEQVVTILKASLQ
ncbi:GAF domain-containing protein [Listeria grandensis]|uniref:GAF domain-containing protein n=1 Tax=Listeria grandensis TaxID=1494963 RepID=UPI0016297A14|nr:GAF domain-containing protein [Listeria grandensis]MBC1473739.1 GAF domain-containing protein [Listeria grandensis]